MTTPHWDVAMDSLADLKTGLTEHRDAVRERNFIARDDYLESLLRRALMQLGLSGCCIRDQIGECPHCDLVSEIARYLNCEIGVNAHV